jgi:hypothetical protein
VKTAIELYEEIQSQIWASGRPENLEISTKAGVIAPFRSHFEEGLADIAKWSRCEQANVVNVIDFCKLHFKCGMTVAKMPNGPIWRVFTVVGENFCQPIHYREVKFRDVECFGRRVMAWAAGTLPTSPTKLPLGFAEASSDTDNQCGRALTGVWAKHEGNIYVAPYLQSVEKLVIEWTGTKTKWEDGDPVNDEQDYKAAIRFFMQFAFNRDYGSPELAASFRMGTPIGSGGYDKALAELIWTCEQKLKIRETEFFAVPEGCATGWCRSLLGPEFESGVAPAVTDLVLAHVGEISSGLGESRLAVSNLVDGFTPTAVLSSGNDSVSGYDVDVGQYWHTWLTPYYGSYGDGAEANKFWPAPGAGDWDLNSLSNWLAFFATPGERRYYDVCLWPVHLFFFDSETDDPDGAIENSIQGQWLKAKMMLSPSPWKIVVMYGNPYASGVPAGATWPTSLRLPFKSWGANLVLSAGLPYYERLDVAGLPFIINGCGGAALAGSANSPISTSQFIKVGSFGAGKITASATELTYEFIDVDSAVVDSVTLTK